MVGVVRTLRNTPEGAPHLVVGAVRRGIDFKRALTPHERLAAAIAFTGPTHHVTYTTEAAGYDDVAHSFRLLVRRIERHRHASGPLMYIGTIAQGLGAGGCHLHLLLWEFPPVRVWRPQGKAVGLESVHLEPIRSGPTNRLAVASYVLGQHESVFGTTKHLENAQHPKGKRILLMPQASTLKKHNPKLFVALDLAKSQSVSDENLCREFLSVNREDLTKTPKEDLTRTQGTARTDHKTVHQPTIAGKSQQRGSTP